VTTISMTTVTQNTSSTFYATAKCTIAGQPGGLLLGIVSDSTLRPVVGANVTATNTPALCNGAPATNQTTTKFTTNDTMWYPLPTDNAASYFIVVSFSNQTYRFNANLRPVSLTCATLYVPSGKTNITINEFQSSCPIAATLNSSNLTCAVTAYQVLGIGSITVQNGTTETEYSTTTSTLSETTFTMTTNVTQRVGYVTTTTTNYQPPSAWTVVVCTYVG